MIPHPVDGRKGRRGKLHKGRKRGEGVVGERLGNMVGLVSHCVHQDGTRHGLLLWVPAICKVDKGSKGSELIDTVLLIQ